MDRPRTLTTAALGVCALCLSLPTASGAATRPANGDFLRYGGSVGQIADGPKPLCAGVPRVDSLLGPPPASALNTIDRFLTGVRSGRQAFDDMSPEMAKAVARGPTLGLPFRAMIEQPTSIQLAGVDSRFNAVYRVTLAGGRTRWNIALDRAGRVDAAFLCYS